MYKLDTTLCLKRKSEHKKGLEYKAICALNTQQGGYKRITSLIIIIIYYYQYNQFNLPYLFIQSLLTKMS